MTDQSVLSRVVARIKAWWPKDWAGEQGDGFRRAVQELDEQTHVPSQEYHVNERRGFLGRLAGKWLSGAASLPHSEVLAKTAEAWKSDIERKLAERTLDEKVEQEHAKTRIDRAQATSQEIDAAQKVIEFADECRRRGIVIDDRILQDKVIDVFRAEVEAPHGELTHYNDER